MAKETMKAIVIAAAETALKALMPHLQDTLSSVRDEVRTLRERIETVEAKLGTRIDESEDKIELKIDALRQEMFDRFEATRDTINELAQRISRVDGALEAYSRIVQSAFPAPRPLRSSPLQGGSKKRRAGRRFYASPRASFANRSPRSSKLTN